MKKVTSICMALVLALTAFSACGTKSTAPPASAGSTASESTVASNEPAEASNEPVVLKGWGAYAFDDSTGNKSYSDQLAWKTIEEKLNITIDWTVVTTVNNNAPTQFGLLMAAKDLPDFFLDINPLLFEEFGRKGALIPLEDVIQSQVPELYTHLKDDPEALGSITSEDGHIYFFPRLLKDPATRAWPGYMIREDWLTELGKEAPQTMDEFYDVLKGFKETIDTVNHPYSGDPRVMIWAFGVGSRGPGNTNDDMFLEDGVIKFGPSDDRYRDAMVYINKLYAEGLLDPEWSGISSDQITTNVMNGHAGVTFGSFSGLLGKFNGLFSKQDGTEPFIALAPMEGPTGVRATQGIHTAVDQGHAGAISSTSQQVDKVAEVFNYLYSEEGIRSSYFGIEGDTFEIVDGKPQYSEKVKTSDLGIMNYVNNYIFNLSTAPSNYPIEVYHSILSEEGIRGNRITTENMGGIKVPALRFSESEIQEVSTLLRDINTYVEENTAAFISGQKDISEWDAYVEGYNKLGLERLVEIYNTSYLRFLAATNA